MRSALQTLFFFCAFLLSVLSSSSAHAEGKPLALIWSGKGACNFCILGALRMADQAGFDYQLVNSSVVEDSVFKRAKVWIQPGGYAVTEAFAMGPSLMNQIKKFVRQGGGYVGFCAGSFLSTREIGTSGETGFGFIPGSTDYHHEEDYEAWQIEKVLTPKGPRFVYFAGGPQFVVQADELKAVGGRVTARANNGHIEAIEARYGKGKIAVSGFHPEANSFQKATRLFITSGYPKAAMALFNAFGTGTFHPAALWESSPYFQIDPDGNDYVFAIEMIRFAASIKD
ncbi:MAG: hypothetical protein H7333_02125 [Bdellovibrionales bacterium]|nr:hypothetical protein [Oligoflexia bacterium]